MATQEESFVNMMDETVDVDAISLSASIDDIGTQGENSRRGPKRGTNFSTQEDKQLVFSCQSISQDPIAGNEKPTKTYWARIIEHYHLNRNFESDRTEGSLQHRWACIQKETNKWQGCYDQIEHRHPSGIPYQQHVVES